MQMKEVDLKTFQGRLADLLLSRLPKLIESKLGFRKTFAVTSPCTFSVEYL